MLDIKQNSHAPCGDIYVCSRFSYTCYTCTAPGRQSYICTTCAKYCHTGHTVVFAGPHHFSCYCGERGMRDPTQV